MREAWRPSRRIRVSEMTNKTTVMTIRPATTKAGVQSHNDGVYVAA